MSNYLTYCELVDVILRKREGRIGESEYVLDLTYIEHLDHQDIEVKLTGVELDLTSYPLTLVSNTSLDESFNYIAGGSKVNVGFGLTNYENIDITIIEKTEFNKLSDKILGDLEELYGVKF